MIFDISLIVSEIAKHLKNDQDLLSFRLTNKLCQEIVDIQHNDIFEFEWIRIAKKIEELSKRSPLNNVISPHYYAFTNFHHGLGCTVGVFGYKRKYYTVIKTSYDILKGTNQYVLQIPDYVGIDHLETDVCYANISYPFYTHQINHYSLFQLVEKKQFLVIDLTDIDNIQFYLIPQIEKNVPFLIRAIFVGKDVYPDLRQLPFVKIKNFDCCELDEIHALCCECTVLSEPMIIGCLEVHQISENRSLIKLNRIFFSFRKFNESIISFKKELMWYYAFIEPCYVMFIQGSYTVDYFRLFNMKSNEKIFDLSFSDHHYRGCFVLQNQYVGVNFFKNEQFDLYLFDIKGRRWSKNVINNPRIDECWRFVSRKISESEALVLCDSYSVPFFIRIDLIDLKIIDDGMPPKSFSV